MMTAIGAPRFSGAVDQPDGAPAVPDLSIRMPRKAKATVNSGFRMLKKQNGAKEVEAMPSVAAM